MKRLLVFGTALLLILGGGATASAQDLETGGVSRADAGAACAAVVGQPANPEGEQEFRAAYNTTSKADDASDFNGLTAEQQRLYYLQELHVDYTGGEPFTCDGATAVFPVEQPEDCDIDSGVDAGESGTVVDGECVSTSPGYEENEIGGACDVATGQPGSGSGIVTDGQCTVPAQEEQPGGETVLPDGVTPQIPVDLNCEDVTAQEAKAIVDADPTDPNNLDGEGDGLACEADDGTNDGVTPVVDETVDAAPAGDLADTGVAGVGNMVGLGALLIGGGLLALWAARQRTA